jgi:uncharacterized membrane protein
MIALHPPISGSPLAFLCLLVTLELLQLSSRGQSLRSFKGVAVISVLLACVASFLSGYQAVSDLGEIPELTDSLISKHHGFGKILLINAVVLATSYWTARVATHGKRFFGFIYYALLASQVVLTVWTGYLGGDLVFDHGLGVRR